MEQIVINQQQANVLCGSDATGLSVIQSTNLRKVNKPVTQTNSFMRKQENVP